MSEFACNMRLSRESTIIQNNPSKFWSVTPGVSPHHWDAEIHNLDDKRHRCRKYRMSIELPQLYPFAPPKCKFLDRVRCENVYEDGRICIDILDDKAWSPIYTIPFLLESIVSVLTDKPVTGLINKAMPSY